MKPAVRQKALLARMLSLILGSLAIIRPFESSGATCHARPLPAFPGAEGFGAKAVGGRGGRVFEVINLNDSGSGSLRNCIIASGPRTCVFHRGGTITLLTPLKVLNPFLTIAGQTAPGGGITLKNDPSNKKSALWIQTHDVIVRYIRSRPGPSNALNASLDAIRVNGSDAVSGTRIGATDVHDVIIDHCSVGWAVDENIALTGAQDTTIQWCIISEGLYRSVHFKGTHSRGLVIRQNSARVTAHHNLMAHHEYRNPQLGHEVDDIEVINNVTYNWKKRAFNGNMTVAGFHTDASIIGNYFKKGVNSSLAKKDIYLVKPDVGTWSLYLKGNIGPSRPNDTMPDSASVDRSDQRWMVPTPSFPPSGMGNTTAAQAYNDVLAKAGARIPVLDSVDQRIISDVQSGTGQLIDHPSQVGGWPVLAAGVPPVDTDHDGMPDRWEQQYGFDSNDATDGAADADCDGYTNVEEFLNVTAPCQLESGVKPRHTATGTCAGRVDRNTTRARRKSFLSPN